MTVLVEMAASEALRDRFSVNTVFTSIEFPVTVDTTFVPPAIGRYARTSKRDRQEGALRGAWRYWYGGVVSAP